MMKRALFLGRKRSCERSALWKKAKPVILSDRDVKRLVRQISLNREADKRKE